MQYGDLNQVQWLQNNQKQENNGLKSDGNNNVTRKCVIIKDNVFHNVYVMKVDITE